VSGIDFTEIRKFEKFPETIVQFRSQLVCPAGKKVRPAHIPHKEGISTYYWFIS